jgi:hypothetical protein
MQNREKKRERRGFPLSVRVDQAVTEHLKARAAASGKSVTQTVERLLLLGIDADQTLSRAIPAAPPEELEELIIRTGKLLPEPARVRIAASLLAQSLVVEQPFRNQQQFPGAGIQQGPPPAKQGDEK